LEDLGVAYSRWQAAILVNIKDGACAAATRLEDDAHPSRPRPHDQIGRGVFNDLHDLDDPSSQHILIGKICNLQGDVEIGFHWDEAVYRAIGKDTVFTEGKGICLCFGLQLLNGLLEQAR